MIARTVRGLGALALAGLALAGWPAALLALTDAVGVWLPDLSDPGALLARPDTGGLFLVIVLALGWIAWVVWTIALVVEVSAQVRGVPTPHLIGLFPQNSATALVTTIAVAFTLAPSSAAVAAEADSARPAAPSANHTSDDQGLDVRHRAGAAADDPEASVDDEKGHYTVVRGDTLWDIADEKLDNATRWPEIAEDSEKITQPDGRQLTDPDLILPGWTLHIPDSAAQAAPAGADEPPPPPPTEADEPPIPETVAPPSTPMQPTPPTAEDDEAESRSAPAHPGFGDRARAGGVGRATSAGVSHAPHLPSTPLSGGADHPATAPRAPLAGPAGYQDEGRVAATHAVPGLPSWITAPLLPTPHEDAPELLCSIQERLPPAFTDRGAL